MQAADWLWVLVPPGSSLEPDLDTPVGGGGVVVTFGLGGPLASVGYEEGVRLCK